MNNTEKNRQLCEKLGWRKDFPCVEWDDTPTLAWRPPASFNLAGPLGDSYLPDHFADTAYGLWARKVSFESLTPTQRTNLLWEMSVDRSGKLSIAEMLFKPVLADFLWKALCK